VPIVLKSGSQNLLEPSGSVQGCFSFLLSSYFPGCNVSDRNIIRHFRRFHIVYRLLGIQISFLYSGYPAKHQYYALNSKEGIFHAGGSSFVRGDGRIFARRGEMRWGWDCSPEDDASMRISPQRLAEMKKYDTQRLQNCIAHPLYKPRCRIRNSIKSSVFFALTYSNHENVQCLLLHSPSKKGR